jgi:O-antigen/teichoic acid export membrane protein
MKPVLLRLAGFTILPLLALVLPFLLLPVISRVVGAPGWSSITAGQAIGVFAATFILWSRNIAGPVAVARSRTPQERASTYSASMRSRLVISSVILPIMSLLVILVAHDGYRLDAVTMAWASALTGFSPAWFGIGIGQPRILVIFDTLPRFLAALLSAPLILATGQVWIYGVLSVVATIGALIGFQRRFGEKGSWLPKSPVAAYRELLPQAGTAGVNLTGSAYASSPVPVATATVPTAADTAGFASADSIYRLGLFSIVALGNTFQGWTLEHDAPNPSRRHAIALSAHILLGVFGGLVLALLCPWISSVMFGEGVKADHLTSLFYGLSFLFLSASTPFIRNVLIPAGRQNTVLRWTAVSAVIGISLMVIAGLSSNVPGVALGMAVSEAVLFVGLLIPATGLLRAMPGESQKVGSTP